MQLLIPYWNGMIYYIILWLHVPSDRLTMWELEIIAIMIRIMSISIIILTMIIYYCYYCHYISLFLIKNHDTMKNP